MMHGAQGGGSTGGVPYALRNGHPYGGRSGYGSASQALGNWATAVEYSNGFPTTQSGGSGGGGPGPMRLSYQHRGPGPYGGKYTYECCNSCKLVLSFN